MFPSHDHTLKDAHTNLKQGIDYLEILAKRDDLPEEKAAEIKKIAGKFIGVGHKNLKDLYDNVVRKRVQYQRGDKEHLEQIILALQNQDVLKDYISANNLLVKKESKMKINKEELKEIILQEVLAALSKEKSLEESVAYHLNAEVGFDKNIHRPGSTMFFALFREARRLYREGSYKPTNSDEVELL